MHRFASTFSTLVLASLSTGLAFLLDGCASASTSPDRRPSLEQERPHIIRVNPNGVLLDLDGKEARSGYAEEHLIRPLRESSFAPSGAYPKGVLLFVHGGLNTYRQAHAHFEYLFPKLKAAGYYPIFLLWPSGLAGTYGDHLLSIRQGRREEGPIGKPFALLTAPLVLAQDFATGLVRTPMTSLETLRSDLQTAIPANSPSAQQDAIKIYRTLLDESRHVTIGNDYKSESEMALRVASYWATLPAKLATAGPVIDALGRPAWDDMIRRTYMVYPGTLANNGQENPKTPAAATAYTRKARQEDVSKENFAKIVRALEEIQANRLQGGQPLPLTLVGHSMGAIVLDHLLEATTLEANRIVYLAAACSIRDFSGSVLPYLAKHKGTISYNLSLHPMAEDGEVQQSFIDLPPRGSLLVWIDNFLSNPVYEQDRTFGRWTNLFLVSPTGNSAIEDLLDHSGIGDRLYFRAFGAGSGEKPRASKYQWNTSKTGLPPKSDEFTPHRHGDMALVAFWDDDVLQGRK